ncbi:hypothetical protein BJ165DRAFT_1399594 [Panaeolus papilionaceus]|nr:hypothetical protein BJ165DRAFT_1399594 [Panaeolus papilionaceus]
MTRVNTPFIPSPQWLTESPANVQLRTPSSRRSTRRPIFDTHNELMSPVPPAPANLFDPNSAAGLSVDPGIPFLATAGPSERGDDSERGSINSEHRGLERGNSFIGGFVKGVKRVVTLPRQHKKEWTLDQQEFYGQQPEIRDSGYASSPNQSTAGPTFPILHTPYYPDDDDARTVTSRYAPSETLIGHLDPKTYSKPYERYQEHPKHSRPYRYEDEETIVGSDYYGTQFSAATSASYVTADPELGSDYAKMNAPTPPMSDVSLDSYVRRFQKLVKTVADLPWVAKERVTADYYPEKNRRCDEDVHPAIIWHNPNATGEYEEDSFDYDALESSNDSSSNSSMLQAPRRNQSHAEIDLDAEFGSTSQRIPQIPLAPSTPYSSRTMSQMHHYPAETPQSSQFFAPPTPWDDRPHTPTQMQQATYVEYVPSTGTRRSTRSRKSAHSRAAQPIYDSQYYAEPSSYYEPRAQADAYSVADGWEEYPHYPNGYVQPEYTEHYYGEQYGTGIHAERPPR